MRAITVLRHVTNPRIYNYRTIGRECTRASQGLVTKCTSKLLSNGIQTVIKTNDFILLTGTRANEYSDLAVKGFNYIQLNRLDKNRILKEAQVV